MLDRKNPPAFVQHKSFELLTPEIQILSNGSKLYAIHGGEQDVLKVELVFNAGKWFESQRGVSYFTGSLLSKGTSNYNSFQLSEILDFYGVHLEIHPGFDFTSVILYGLSKNLLVVLDLLVEILSNPTFPENELKQALDIYTQGLKINLEKTSYLASQEFRKNIFGKLHPYGSDVEIDDIDHIQRNHLTDFHKKYFRDFVVFISGKISDTTKNLISSKLGHLKTNKEPSILHNRLPFQIMDYYLAKPNSIQTSLRIGKLTIGRHHHDYPGLLLLNHLLGGFFGSRLMKNIREEKGLTYGIHSSIHSLKQNSYFVIGADVNIKNRELAILEIKKELQLLQNKIVNAEELEVARNHFIGSLQTELNTPFAHADKLKLITLFNLPDDYYQQLLDTLFKVTKDQLLDVAKRYFNEDQLFTVSVG